MAESGLSDQDWAVRLAVYQHIVDSGRPPTYAELAPRFGMSAEHARLTYHRLHRQHALFLEPGADTIRMANPLSALPTPYRVHANGRWLWANCAWDSFGIPAMLHADARIEAVFAHSEEPVSYEIEGGRPIAGDWVVHFAVPFRHWYDNLIHT